MVFLTFTKAFLFRGTPRVPVTSKQGKKDFYVSRGVEAKGKNIKDGFKLEKWRIYQFVVPDLTGFQLKPYVSLKTPQKDVSTVSAEDLTHLSREEIKIEI